MTEILEDQGFRAPKAAECAGFFAEASRDGVQSHGLNRFPRFIRNIRDGLVDPAAEPRRVASSGALERWDGMRGAGVLNASVAMARAVELARDFGIGCVALSNTNHWMRAGAYGWQAAEAGMVGICWTNTLPNLPPWGSERPLVGNNPLVIAVPKPPGHVVLDMAMSQFSYGAMEGYTKRGERLPVVGGFDSAGKLTDDPAAVLESGRPLPTGFWKGSGLALLLDLVAAALSGGRATHEIDPDFDRESDLSQVFIAATPARASVADEAIAALQADGARYPGERVIADRADSLAHGVPVDAEIWAEVRGLS